MGVKVVAQNKKARFNYHIDETCEAGIELLGSEVKSLRNGKASLSESFVRPRGNELFLVGCHIAEYEQANVTNHEPLRPRKLLLHRREIDKLISRQSQKGCTLVALSIYFKQGLAKVQVAVARGKRQFDKREALKQRDADRDIKRQMRSRE